MTSNGPADESPSDESPDEEPVTSNTPPDDPPEAFPSSEEPATDEPATDEPATGPSPEDADRAEPSAADSLVDPSAVESSASEPATGGESYGTAPVGEAFAYLGYAAVAVGFGGVLAAVLLAPPWFSVFTGALSLLGFSRLAVAPLFNASLIVGGALGAGFVASLWATAEQPFHLAAVPFLLLATVCMSLVGVFPIPEGPHLFALAAFFLFLTLGVLLWGLGDYAAGRGGRAAALILLPVVHVVTWVWWFALPWFPPGIAVPELAGVVAFVVWALWVSTDRLGLTVASTASQGAT